MTTRLALNTDPALGIAFLLRVAEFQGTATILAISSSLPAAGTIAIDVFHHPDYEGRVAHFGVNCLR
jgi:hypothetical protein